MAADVAGKADKRAVDLVASKAEASAGLLQEALDAAKASLGARADAAALQAAQADQRSAEGARALRGGRESAVQELEALRSSLGASAAKHRAPAPPLPLPPSQLAASAPLRLCACAETAQAYSAQMCPFA